MTLPAFAGQAVYAAVTGAEVTRLKYLPRPYYPGFKLPGLVKCLVSGYLPLLLRLPFLLSLLNYLYRGWRG
jgi:hypothetical protein